MAGMSSPLSKSTAHAAAADAAADFFASAAIVDAVLLVGSWARGHADKASDLDVAVLIRRRFDGSYAGSRRSFRSVRCVRSGRRPAGERRRGR